jgi:hypothetical protein
MWPSRTPDWQKGDGKKGIAADCDEETTFWTNALECARTLKPIDSAITRELGDWRSRMERSFLVFLSRAGLDSILRSRITAIRSNLF